MGFVVAFLNVHELISAGSHESFDRHLLCTFVFEKLGWISEQGALA